MLKKIISSGQAGAGLAALDVALKLDIPHSGYISRGRITEQGRLPDIYQLEEVNSFSYTSRTEKNVLAGQGTLIITRGPLVKGTVFARQTALANGRPCHHCDLNRQAIFGAAQNATAWITKHQIEVLHVTGSRQSDDREIYQLSRQLLETIFQLNLIEENVPNPFQPHGIRDELIGLSMPPESVEEAVNRLVRQLSFKQKTRLARVQEEAIDGLMDTLGIFIITEFKLWGNTPLKAACRDLEGLDNVDQETAALVIMRALHKELNKNGRVLKVVK